MIMGHLLWDKLIRHFHDELSLPALAPQTTLFGLLDYPINIKQIINHILKLMSKSI